MKTCRTDIWGEEVFVGDTIRIGTQKFIIKYGNYHSSGLSRIGIYAEALFPVHPDFRERPLEQMKSFIRVKATDEKTEQDIISHYSKVISPYIQSRRKSISL